MTGAPLHDTFRQTAITGAVLKALHLSWPVAIDLVPSTLDPAAADEHRLFVQAVRDLIAEGLMTIEALLIGSGDEPVARGAMLTREGLGVLDQVTRPM